MKHSKLIFSIVLLTSLLYGCEQAEENIQPEPLISIETIDPSQDNTLQELINGFQPKSFTNGRTLSFDFGEVDFSTALKAINEKDTVVRYSLAITESTDLSFENVIFKNKNGEENAYILRYEPDPTWLESNNFEFVEATFTGLLYMLNLERTVMAKVVFIDGVGSLAKDFSPIGGRTECDGVGVGTTGGGSTGGGSSGGGGGGSTGGTGGGTSGEGSTGGGTSGGSTSGGSTGGGGGSGVSCDWGTSETTGGLWVDCPGLDIQFIGLARTECDEVPSDLGDGDGDGNGPIGILPNINITPFLVNALLEDDPFALIDIGCDQIENWQALAQHIPSQGVINKLNDVDNNTFGDVDVQSIADASGAVVNMDYFPITISTLPNNPDTNLPYSASGLLNHIRTNINDFIDTQYSEFSPSTITGFNEAALWNSDNPIGAILHINIPTAGDGSVICSDYSTNNWVFTTIEVPYNLFVQGADGEHPVSGNREFGYHFNPDGSYTFYTRGVDRITSAFDATIVENLDDNPFSAPDNLWNSLKQGIYDYVQENGGDGNQPSDADNSIARPNWEDVKDVLNGDKPISDLGCN